MQWAFRSPHTPRKRRRLMVRPLAVDLHRVTLIITIMVLATGCAQPPDDTDEFTHASLNP